MTIYQLPFNRLTLFIIHFSVLSVFSVAENLSIKNNKLCKTNPISKKPKMKLTLYPTKEYENKSGLSTMEKQTQSNPICSELARPELACGELVEPVEGVEPISKGTWQSGVLYIEAVRQFFERAAGAFGVGSAKFFAESYQERMVFIEKLSILRQI